MEKASYDVVLMDMQMPELDGLQTTRLIRKRWQGTVPHVIAMTASSMERDQQACHDAGMNDFLVKPVRMADLRNAFLRGPLKEHPAESPRLAPPRIAYL